MTWKCETRDYYANISKEAKVGNKRPEESGVDITLESWLVINPLVRIW